LIHVANLDLRLADWGEIAQIALAITAVLAFVGAIVQIRLARSASRQVLTYNYTDRFANPELLPYHQKTIDLFNLGGADADQRYEAFLGWRNEDQLAALLVPNLFEELAGMYNQGLLHKGITKDFFGQTAVDLWNIASWFIERSQQSNERYYVQWQRMLEDMDLL